MLTIELSEEAGRKLKAFGKIMEVILGQQDVPKTESDRAEPVIPIGLEHMLQDVLPREDMLLRTMAQMFDRNPEFVCEFVSNAIKQGGGEKQKQQADEARQWWAMYA